MSIDIRINEILVQDKRDGMEHLILSLLSGSTLDKRDGMEHLILSLWFYVRKPHCLRFEIYKKIE
jgi:hypothetical protein